MEQEHVVRPLCKEHPSRLTTIMCAAGVLCVEELDIAVAPLALAVEQEHATRLVDLASAAAEPFSGPRPGAGFCP